MNTDKDNKMIDKIKITKKNLETNELKELVFKNNLQKYTGLLETTYTNIKTKNFTGGWYIRIDGKNNLIIEGSLHKYHNWNVTNKLDNHNRFTMQQAKETILLLIELTGLKIEGVTITSFEVGINIITNFEPIEFLDNIRSIGNFTNEKKLYINPRYKERKFLTTEFHKDYRIVFKAYDKIYEMKDKKKETPKNTNILRIETVHKRCEKKILGDFLKIENLIKIQDSFFNEWDRLNFFVGVLSPKNTQSYKIDWAKDLYNKNKTKLLERLNNDRECEVLSVKQYIAHKKFIENWNIEKNKFTPIKTKICQQWEISYNTEKQILT